MDETAAQAGAIEHAEAPLLVLGEPGTGKSEALARRLASLVADRGVAPDRVLMVASTHAGAERLRTRVESLLDDPHGELWVGTWDSIGERVLREYSDAAGLDPFFEVLGPAERLAMLLDRLDDLPLRRHEIRGNPAGLLARLLERIDALKAGADAPDAELADLVAAHDRILAATGNLDRGDVFLTLNRLNEEREDVRDALAERFVEVMVDELEDTTTAQRALLASLAKRNPRHVYALEPAGAELGGWYREVHPDGDAIQLEHLFRDPAAAVLALRQRARPGPGRRPRGRDPALSRDPARRRLRPDRRPGDAGRAGRGGDGGARDPVPPLRAGGALPAARGARRDRLAAGARRPGRLGGGGAGADPAADRAPPADLARLTTIARRRKLDMVSACEAALESPRIPPEARERIQDFLKLYGEASAAMEERRADVFVRRLIERVGIRRQRLFAAQPEVAERLLGLSRLAELATAWARREPHGSTRDFVRHLSAVAETGVEPAGVTEPPAPDSVQGLARDAAKGMGFDHVFVLGLEQDDAADRIGRPARSGLVLSRIERDDGGEVRPSPFYTGALAAAGAKEERHAEELFGPAEGLHATYRSLREEVLEESWKAGRQLSEPRLDTAVDVNRAIARFLELLKLAALAQRPGDAQPTEEAVDAVNGLLRQVATPEQQAELDASALDSYLLDSESRREGRRKLIGARHEPSLEAFLPRRGDGGLSLSASDLGLYLTCPLKYKFARVFGIPQEPTINQRFGILIHNVLERFHKEESDGGEDDLERLMALFEAGWRRSGFGTSDDELQYRERAREALRLYCEREGGAEGEPVWLERKFDIKIGDHHVRGRVDRVDRLPDGEHELIDYKTGERKSESDLESDLQLALYRLAARQAWDIEASHGSYYYVLDAEKVAAPTKPDDAERVERTVLEVGAGILDQDFEPRPSPAVCSWCDYRLICPAAES